MRSFTRSLRALPRAFPVVNSPRSLHITARRLEATSKPSSADDPYPLPLSPDHVTPESNKPGTSPRDVEVDLSDPGLPFPEPLSREGESVDQKRARLVYQTRKRGTLESDLLMSTFAKEHMDSMNEEELREFDRFLDENDWDTFYWATGKRQPPARWEGSPLLAKIAKHAMNEDKVARRMPSL